MGLTKTEKQLLKAIGYKAPKGYEIYGVEFPNGIRIVDFDLNIPAGVPQKPIALGGDTLTNRDRNDKATLTASVSKTIEESETLSWEVSFSTTTTQEVCYGAAPGAGVSGKTSVSVTVGGGRSGSHTETNSIEVQRSISIDVDPRTSQTLEYVIGERKVDRIPWTAFMRPIGRVKVKLQTSHMWVKFYKDKNFQGRRRAFEFTKDTDWKSTSKYKYSDGDDLDNDIRSLEVKGGTLILFKHHLPCNDPQTFKPGRYKDGIKYSHGAKFRPEAQKKTAWVDFSDFKGITIKGEYGAVRISEGQWEVEEGQPID